MTVSRCRDLSFNICRLRRPDGSNGFVDVVTLLAPEAFLKHGIAAEAIVGFCTRLMGEGEKLDPSIFRANKPFVDLLHEVISTNAPAVSELQAAALRQHTGWTYILDGRTPTPQGHVPPHDIMGAFEVRDGVIVLDSYRANQNHLLLSTRGFFKLPVKSLQDALMERVIKAATPNQ